MNFNDLLLYVISFFGLYTAIFFLVTLYENWGAQHTTKRLRKHPLVAVIVPCYNEERTVAKTLESLLALDYPQEKLDIIVVDDGSKDATYTVAAGFKKQGIRVFRKKNGGKHSALNLGLKKTKARFVGALDADSTVEPDALSKIIVRFQEKEVMAVTPSMKINTPKGILRRIQSVEFIIGIFLRRVFADLGSQHVTPGPFTIYRKEFFETYGTYRPAHLTEDIEMALRIQSHHFHIENATDAYVYTHGPRTWRSLFQQRLRWYYGFLSNVIDYRHLMTPKHGNLGLFILPSSFISIFLVIISATYILGKMLVDTWHTFTYYAAVGFDIWNLFDPHFNPFFINTSGVMILSMIGLVVGLALFLISRHMAQDKEPWKLSYFFFFLLYWLFFGLWWLVAGFYKVTGRKVGWSHKSTFEVNS